MTEAAIYRRDDGVTNEARTACAWALAGVGWVITGILGLGAVDGTGGFYAAEAAWLAIHALVLVGLVGLVRGGVVGRSAWGRAGLRLAIAGRVMFFVAEIAAIVAGHDELALFPVAAVSTAVGMLMAGIAVLRGQRWQGWRRYTLIVMGGYPFVFMFPILAVTGERPNLGVSCWGLTFIGIAAAVALPPGLGRCSVEVTTEAAVATAEGQGETSPQQRVHEPST